MSQVTCSGSIPNPVCAKLKKLSSRRFKFNTEISTPKLAFWFSFFSSAILFLCCGRNSDVSVKNISVLPFVRKPFITVSQLGHARYYHKDPPKSLRRATFRNSFVSRRNSCIVFWSICLYFILIIHYLFFILFAPSLPSDPGLSICHPPLHYFSLLLTLSFLVLKKCYICVVFVFFLIWPWR